jgi:hypothetical protein
LRGYYVALNYSDGGHIGFNGAYSAVEYHKPKPLPSSSPIAPEIIILVIGGILLFVSVGICVCIKKKNEQLQHQLEQQTQGGPLEY